MARPNTEEQFTSLSVADQYDNMDRELRALAKKTGQISVPRSTSFSRRNVVAAFASAFEMIGGIPRLALWAHDNPSEFYKLYGKLLPSATTVDILASPRGEDMPLRTYTTAELEAMLATTDVASAEILPFPVQVPEGELVEDE